VIGDAHLGLRSLALLGLHLGGRGVDRGGLFGLRKLRVERGDDLDGDLADVGGLVDQGPLGVVVLPAINFVCQCRP
jgi:hypothetical protein